jgi:hypothetical protein
MILELIIRGDIMMIHFLHPTGIFLVSNVTEKTWTDMHSVVFYALWVSNKTWFDAHFKEILPHLLRCMQNL